MFHDMILVDLSLVSPKITAFLLSRFVYFMKMGISKENIPFFFRFIYVFTAQKYIDSLQLYSLI